MASPTDLAAHLNDASTQLAQIPSSPDEAIAKGKNLENLISQGQSLSPAGLVSLAEQGLTFATSEIIKIGGPQYAAIANLAGDALGGALEGGALAGPYGAALGFAAGIIQGLSSLGTFQGVTAVGGVSKATEELTKHVNGYSQSYTNFKGNPLGWAMADYCSQAFPPWSTSNTAAWQALVACSFSTDPAWNWMKSNVPMDQIGRAIVFGSPPYTPGNVADGFGNWHGDWPLCTPVFWNWTTPSQIADCHLDLYFWAGAPGTPANLKQGWRQYDTRPSGLSKYLTPDRIISNAIRYRPDPLFHGATLYGSTVPSDGPGGGYTTYRNPDGINATTSCWNMLGRGSSPMSVLSELCLHVKALDQDGNKWGDTQPNAGQPFQLGNAAQPDGLPSVEWSMQQAAATVHALIEYYSAMCRCLARKQKWTGPEMWKPSKYVTVPGYAPKPKEHKAPAPSPTAPPVPASPPLHTVKLPPRWTLAAKYGAAAAPAPVASSGPSAGAVAGGVAAGAVALLAGYKYLPWRSYL